MKEKELKSKIREHKLYGKQYSYILDSINPDNIDIDGENMSDKERLIVQNGKKRHSARNGSTT